MKEQPITTADMAARYRRCASASIYDVLDRMDLPNQCVSLEIKPLRDDMTIAGPAFTVRGTREPRLKTEVPQFPKFKDFGMFKAMFPGCIVTINAEKEDQAGHFGEMMSYTARQHGAAGLVIDGGTRDRRGLLQIPDWPVFVRYTSPIESVRRWRPEDYLVPIYLSGTLTRYVRVDPSDWIVGDADGIMVIPQDIAYEVLLKVEEMEASEEGSRADLASGMSIEEVYAKYGRM